MRETKARAYDVLNKINESVNLIFRVTPGKHMTEFFSRSQNIEE